VVPKEKRIVPEDYFRVLKQNKEADPKALRGRPKTAYPSRGSVINGGGSANGDSVERGVSPDRYGPYIQHLVHLIHPEMDEEEALALIELPQETIYVIDKVVR